MVIKNKKVKLVNWEYEDIDVPEFTSIRKLYNALKSDKTLLNHKYNNYYVRHLSVKIGGYSFIGLHEFMNLMEEDKVSIIGKKLNF